MDLEIGARYPSFKALEAAVEKFSQETNSVYTVYNSRLIEKENLRRPADKQLPSCLKYKHIKFACKHYGMRKSKSRGLRPNQSTFKIGCPSYIYVTAHSKELVVEKMEVEHTHSCDPELVALYPERRSLSHLGSDDGEEEDGDRPGNSTLKLIREDVYDLLTLAVDRRRIRNYVRICTGRVMLTGDLANMAKYVRQNPRAVTDERASQLLQHLKLVESKENVPTTRPMTTREKFNAMKRRVALPSEINRGEGKEDDPPEHCYSVGPPAKRCRTSKRSDDNIIRIEHVEHTDNFGDEIQEEQAAATWDHTSSLADVVKSILGPNQEGPVIVHVNNYEGVAVVEVAEAQKYGTGEEIDPSSLLVQKQDVGDTPLSMGKRTARKSLSPRKPVIVSNKTTGSRESIPTSKVVINTMNSRSEDTVQLHKSQIEQDGHQEDYEGEDDDDFNPENVRDDDSDTNSEHGSVLREERTMYRVKTQKLRLQIRHLENENDMHELVKEKLRLEIRLLELEVDEKEKEQVEKQSRQTSR